ncbi:hypothetical protein BDW68DRAFT_184490 [Aspergillus falconensis]
MLYWCSTFRRAQEAVACFEQAIAHDELCAIAYWGLAYALGPTITRPQDVAQSATPIEQALIERDRFASDKLAENFEQYASQNQAPLQNPGTRTLDAKNMLERALPPELGLVPADHLRELVPDSGHANHMLSHLDVLTGDYRAAIRANQRATTADAKYLHYEGAMNFYSNYRMHNYHILIYAAVFEGQKAIALDAVERMEKTLPNELLASLADFVEVCMSEEIIHDLSVPADQELYCVTTAMVYYAKGIAHAATGNIQEAKRYRTLYTAAAQSVPESRLDFPNKCTDILAIAYKSAFLHLARAVQLDDSLCYSEPWSWMQPARHAYAALLLEQNYVEGALAVHKSDSALGNCAIRARRHANNVWAPRGYHECPLRLGRSDEAAVIEPQLKVAVTVADAEVTKSCFCARGVDGRAWGKGAW